jgi:hypothetical protein
MHNILTVVSISYKVLLHVSMCFHHLQGVFLILLNFIQTELAFTLAKNATKPNPFEIISLQTARKDTNWKTEKTFARAVVTLETERIKGSNP